MRSLVAKLPDIHADKNSHQLAYCVSVRIATQPTPVLLDDHIDIRCDRVTSENKVGVLICVPSHISPTNVHRFVTSGIEAVSATVHYQMVKTCK